jgi:hypothetical protein
MRLLCYYSYYVLILLAYGILLSKSSLSRDHGTIGYSIKSCERARHPSLLTPYQNFRFVFRFGVVKKWKSYSILIGYTLRQFCLCDKFRKIFRFEKSSDRYFLTTPSVSGSIAKRYLHRQVVLIPPGMSIREYRPRPSDLSTSVVSIITLIRLP